jgi:hypothetical protein
VVTLGEDLLKKISILFLGLIVLSGCAKATHLDQLLTLKGLADEQREMNRYIEEQDQRFKLMLDEVQAGTIGQYLNKKRVLRAFGDPIFVKNVERDGRELESWMYRYSTQFFDSEKIYLYFDPEDNLAGSEYRGKQDGEIR